MGALVAFCVLVALLGLVTLVLGYVLILAVGIVVALSTVLLVGNWHTRRVMARPVPCRICDGLGLLEYPVRVCLVCQGSGTQGRHIDLLVRDGLA